MFRIKATCMVYMVTYACDNHCILSSTQICISGPHVFMGYLNNEEKTSEAIDDDKWLHSRDIGKLQVSINCTSKESLSTCRTDRAGLKPITCIDHSSIKYCNMCIILRANIYICVCIKLGKLLIAFLSELSGTNT